MKKDQLVHFLLFHQKVFYALCLLLIQYPFLQNRPVLKLGCYLHPKLDFHWSLVFLPNSLNLKSSGAVIILLALFVSFFWLSIFSQGLSLSVFDTLASFLGPIFGVIIADFYFVQNKKINHKELFYPEETTVYIYNSGWNLKALYSVLIGFIFSASTIWNINLLNIQSFGWLIGALVSYILYLLLKK